MWKKNLYFSHCSPKTRENDDDESGQNGNDHECDQNSERYRWKAIIAIM